MFFLERLIKDKELDLVIKSVEMLLESESCQYNSELPVFLKVNLKDDKSIIDFLLKEEPRLKFNNKSKDKLNFSLEGLIYEISRKNL